MSETPKIKLPVGGDPIPPIPPVPQTIKIENVDYNINDKGEAVDKDGKVFKSKDEVEKLKNPTPPQTEEEKKKAAELVAKKAEIEKGIVEGTDIELDGVQYKVNKDGAIEKDGKVFKTKAELVELFIKNEESADVNYASEIQKVTNLTITDNAGKPVTYENNIEGLSSYVNDVYRTGRELGAKEHEQKLFAQFPILKDVIEHITINGSLKNFNEQVDYSKITIGDTEEQQIAIYTQAKLAQGMSQAEITEMLGYLKTDKKLKTAAETGLTWLKSNQEKTKQDNATKIAAAKAQQDAAETAYWSEVDKVLTDKTIKIGDKTFKLPDAIKVKEADGKIVTKTITDFKDYITKPVNFRINNQIYTMTQHDYDELVEDNNRTTHNDLFDAYRRFTKYDDTQLVAANISSESVKKIIKLSTKATSGGSTHPGGTGKIVTPIK